MPPAVPAEGSAWAESFAAARPQGEQWAEEYAKAAGGPAEVMLHLCITFMLQLVKRQHVPSWLELLHELR